MAKVSQEEEANLTVEWLGEVRDAEFQEELRFVPRFDDTTGSLKLVPDEKLPTKEDEDDDMSATPVAPVDLDEDYYDSDYGPPPPKRKTIAEECDLFMAEMSSSLEKFQREMDLRWKDLLSPVSQYVLVEEPSLGIFQELVKSGV